MKAYIGNIVVEGTVPEISQLIKCSSSDQPKKLDMRKNSSYPSGIRPWKSGCKGHNKGWRKASSRSSIAMKMIGFPETATFTDLKPGSIEQKNYWRACEYLRGNVKKFNPIPGMKRQD